MHKTPPSRKPASSSPPALVLPAALSLSPALVLLSALVIFGLTACKAAPDNQNQAPSWNRDGQASPQGQGEGAGSSGGWSGRKQGSNQQGQEGQESGTWNGARRSPGPDAAASGASGGGWSSGQGGDRSAGDGNRAAGSGGSGGPGGGAGPGAGGNGRTGFGATISVKTWKVKTGPLLVEHQNPGTVVAVTTSQVAALGSGVVTKVLVRPGDWVSAGQTVVILDQRQALLQVQNAQAVLDNANLNLSINSRNSSDTGPKLQLQQEAAESTLAVAQRNYDSAEAQFNLGGISRSDLDNYKALLQQAKANLETARISLNQNLNAGDQTLAQLRITVTQASIALQQAQLTLANTRITAPFSGQIMAMNAAQGAFLGQSSAAFTLVSAERNVSFAVSPNDSPLLRPGMKVSFISGGKTWPARISQAPSAPANGLVAMTASLDKARELPFGAVGTVSYQASLGTGPQVPVTSLLNRGAQLYLYVVENGKAVNKDVSILVETGNIAIVEGLKNGEEVILNPPPGLLAGSALKVISPAATPAPGADAPASGAPTESKAWQQWRKGGKKPGSGGTGGTEPGTDKDTGTNTGSGSAGSGDTGAGPTPAPVQGQ